VFAGSFSAFAASCWVFAASSSAFNYNLASTGSQSTLSDGGESPTGDPAFAGPPWNINRKQSGLSFGREERIPHVHKPCDAPHHPDEGEVFHEESQHAHHNKEANRLANLSFEKLSQSGNENGTDARENESALSGNVAHACVVILGVLRTLFAKVFASRQSIEKAVNCRL
jgi:hypothetical protein